MQSLELRKNTSDLQLLGDGLKKNNHNKLYPLGPPLKQVSMLCVHCDIVTFDFNQKLVLFVSVIKVTLDTVRLSLRECCLLL